MNHVSPTHEASVPDGDHESVSVNYLWDFFSKTLLSPLLIGTRPSCINACVGETIVIKRDMR